MGTVFHSKLGIPVRAQKVQQCMDILFLDHMTWLEFFKSGLFSSILLLC